LIIMVFMVITFVKVSFDIRSNFRVIKNLAQNPTLLYSTLLCSGK
jgi:hypothetical protein